MKFLCENCKAKYQIADDKVAGRTVRMKCRKCSHMIEVEASVTETSVNAATPEDDKPRAGGVSSGVSAAKGAVQAVAAGLAPPRAGSPQGPAPRPLGSSPRGRAATPVPAAPPSRPPSPKAPPPKAAPAPASAGLAGAFSKTVAASSEDPASAAMAVLSSSSNPEEWYVGINGVPVGPVRLSDLRRKAAAGLITEESLVWREGFEEWVPLRTFPELCAMLKESASAGRTSLTPPTPPAQNLVPSNRPLSSYVGGRAPIGSAGARPSVTPRPAMGPAARSNVVAFASRRATAEKIEGLSEPSVEEEIKVDTASERPPAPAAAAPQPESAAAAAVAAPIVDVPASLRHSGFGSRIVQSRRTHPALWLVVGLGGVLFGVAAMVVLLPKANLKPAVQIVSVMVPAPPVPTAAPPSENEGNTTIGQIEVTAPATPTKPAGGSKTSKAAPVETAPAGAPAAPLSTSLTGLGGLVGGPSAPSGGSSQGGGGGQLTAVDIERVVQTHRPFVKRQCWEPALATKTPGSPSSARVVLTMNVASDGRVQDATASGGDGYPGLSSCVQGQVRNWRFPPSDGSKVTVPFVFAAQ